ncbi:MAG: DUF4126 domain-containing protein [Anaerolineales bacterium]
MDAISGIFSALGLSASAGLNAYIPLLVVALLARYTTWLRLAPPWDHLTNGWVIAALAVLLLIEVLADKIPVVNHINDAIQTFVRPAAGAILFAASAQSISGLHPVLAILCGLLVAGSVHAVKAVAIRPAVTATTGGAANVLVSTGEDLLATALSIVAALLPVLLGALICLVAAWIILKAWRRANGSMARVEKRPT